MPDQGGDDEQELSQSNVPAEALIAAVTLDMGRYRTLRLGPANDCFRAIARRSRMSGKGAKQTYRSYGRKWPSGDRQVFVAKHKKRPLVQLQG